MMHNGFHYHNDFRYMAFANTFVPMQIPYNIMLVSWKLLISVGCPSVAIGNVTKGLFTIRQIETVFHRSMTLAY